MGDSVRRHRGLTYRRSKWLGWTSHRCRRPRRSSTVHRCTLVCSTGSLPALAIVDRDNRTHLRTMTLSGRASPPYSANIQYITGSMSIINPNNKDLW